MLTTWQYYQRLYESLILKRKDVFDNCLAYDSVLTVLPPETEGYTRLNRLLGEVEEKYGFHMTLNYKQLYLWQQNFCPVADDASLLAAGKLVLFCCLVDNVLDSPRFFGKEKESVCDKLLPQQEIDLTSSPKGHFAELDALRDEAYDFYMHTYDNAYSTEAVMSDLALAFRSEAYMYRSRLRDCETLSASDLPLLTDKSVRFEKAALLTASFGHNTKRSIKAAVTMGKIFWLTDDLCDLIDDIHAKRKNSLLFFYADSSAPLSLLERAEAVYQHMNQAVADLWEELENLRGLADKSLYAFMVAQVWKWCCHVRRFLQESESAESLT